MAIDVAVLCVLLFFGLLGALTGASRQLTQLLALIGAAVCARLAGTRVAPLLVEHAGVPRVLSSVAGVVLVFLAVYMTVRLTVTPLLRRALAGEDREHEGTDRSLGFVVGALKAGAVLYVLLSAATFVEDTVVVRGHPFDIGLRDTVSGGLARRFNLFRWADVGPARKMAELARRTQDGEEPAGTGESPALRQLEADPRFRRLLKDPDVAEAFRHGDWDALLRNDAVQRLTADPEFARRLEAAAGP